MAKDPAFLFYPGDWLSGTMYLTHEQKGAYMDLLILQFNCGKFTEAQAKQVLSICFDVAWPMLQKKFKKEGEVYFNVRLQTEIEKRKKFTQSRRDNAKGNKSKDKTLPKTKKHMHEHMEDEDINKDIIDYETMFDNTSSIIVDKQKKLFNDILVFFGYDGIHFLPQRELAFGMVYSLPFHNRLDYAIEQIGAYFELRADGQYKHELKNFLGSQDERFQKGAWNDNWKLKLENHKKQNGTTIKQTPGTRSNHNSTGKKDFGKL